MKRKLAPVNFIFNVANFVVGSVVCWEVYHVLHSALQPIGSQMALLLSCSCAALAFSAVNHGTLILMIALRDGHRPRDVFQSPVAILVLAMAALGVTVAALWRTAPWAVPFALTPLLLLDSLMRVEHLEVEAGERAKQLEEEQASVENLRVAS